MPVYLITYDLKSPDKDYEGLHEEIKKLGQFKHPLKSTWYVYTNRYDVKTITDKLKKKIDQNDSLFVCGIKNYNGLMPKGFWDWFKIKVSN